MARKKKAVVPDAPKSPESPEVSLEEAPMARKGLIKVRATRVNMHEPFQHIPLPVGMEVPIEDSSWVSVQIAAGLLEKVE